jgi:hypothetical protein
MHNVYARDLHHPRELCCPHPVPMTSRAFIPDSLICDYVGILVHQISDLRVATAVFRFARELIGGSMNFTFRSKKSIPSPAMPPVANGLRLLAVKENTNEDVECSVAHTQDSPTQNKLSEPQHFINIGRPLTPEMYRKLMGRKY